MNTPNRPSNPCISIGIPSIQLIFINLTIEKLNNLPPVFRQKGYVTVGNTPPLNDGASTLVLISKEKLNDLDQKPLGKIVDFGYGNVEPEYMGIGPIPAIRNLLDKTGLKKDDIDFYEINEAQAQQVLFCIKGLELDINKINVHGGAIALGHPPGMTGARLILTALYTLKKSGKKYAICSLCAGGGTGMAILLEKI
ncbi:MAG: hypothetical protein GF317_15215 [Candidatus Lokiarchaeota archaeon]|nr:hypothetical protein [Candidatus Lokiarchaeota archaeon]MBD3200924.1 hypothetical protein [Candidatus Lokiarchaeota archaeon]